MAALKVNKFMNPVFLCEAFIKTHFMFINPSPEVVRYAYIHDMVILVRQYINIIIIHTSVCLGEVHDAVGFLAAADAFVAEAVFLLVKGHIP